MSRAMKSYRDSLEYADAPVKQGERRDERQVKNRSGAYVYQVTPWDQLNRFLILGSDRATYYASEKKIVKENVTVLKALVDEDGIRVLNETKTISVEGRALKNEPALVVLAYCASYQNALKPDYAQSVRSYAYTILTEIARTPTDLFHVAQYIKGFKKNTWSRGLRKAFARFYEGKTASQAAFLAGKYQSRDGWSQSDLIRLVHPKSPTPQHAVLYEWIRHPENFKSGEGMSRLRADLPQIWALEQLREINQERDDNAPTSKVDNKVLKLVKDHRLPEEYIPTELLSVRVMEEMVNQYGVKALIRNLRNLSKDGVLADGKYDAINSVVDRLTNEEALKKARIHPMDAFIAMKEYQSGKNRKGESHPVVSKVVDALDDAFYKCFQNVEPTGKRFTIGLDVSGSMGMYTTSNGISAREASAAVLLPILATEKNTTTLAFCDRIVPLDISPKMRLDAVVKKISGMPFGSTDISLPFEYALKHKIPTDVFIVITDNETNQYGRKQPVEALREYREKTGIDAKLIVLAVTADKFTIADPNDRGMIDLAGLDSNIPKLIREFALGNI